MTEKKEKEVKEADENIPQGAFVEVEDADFYKFEKIGDTLEGFVTDIGKSERYDFGLYDLKVPTGETKRFHGTQQLDSLMKNITVHDYIKVTYLDNQALPQGSLKIFKVEKKGD